MGIIKRARYSQLWLFAAVFLILAAIALLFANSQQVMAAPVLDEDRWVSRREIVFNKAHYFYYGTIESTGVQADPSNAHLLQSFDTFGGYIFAKGKKSGDQWAPDTSTCNETTGTYGTVPSGGFIYYTEGASLYALSPTSLITVNKDPDNNPGTTECKATSREINIASSGGKNSLFTLYTKANGKLDKVAGVMQGEAAEFTYEPDYSTNGGDVFIRPGYTAADICKDAIVRDKATRTWYMFPVDTISAVESNALWAKNIEPKRLSGYLYGSESSILTTKCRINSREPTGGWNLQVKGTPTFVKDSWYDEDSNDYPGLKENKGCHEGEDREGDYIFKNKLWDRDGNGLDSWYMYCHTHDERNGDGADIDFYRPDPYNFIPAGTESKDSAAENFHVYVDLSPYFTPDDKGGYRMAYVDTVVGLVPPSQVEPPPAPDTDGGGADATQCNIPKVGWMLCPILETTADIADSAYQFIASNFLNIEPGLFNSSSPTYQAWIKFRDIANVAFVVAMIIIIYSQLTGAGLSNYGVKKMLPKLVVAAILVNLSYFICQLAVDASNILGASLKGFFDGIGSSLTLADGNFGEGSGVSNGGMSWKEIVGAIIIGAALTALLWLSLAALIPMMGVALIAMITILFILLARKALIVLLIAVSPLAFVAYLLPNTEKWFDKWKDMFVKLLMVYPIIAVVFGASGLAAKIVQGAAAGTDSILLGIIGAGISVIPLFVVPGLLKGAISAAGAIGAKINNIGDKAGNWTGKKAGDRFERTALMRGRALRKQAKSQYRDQQFARRVAAGGVSSRVASGLGLSRAGRFANQRLATSAAATADKADEQEISDVATTLTRAGVSQADWQQLALGNDIQVNGKTVKASGAARRAAVRKQASSGDHTAVSELVNNAGSMDADVRRDLASSLGSSGNKPVWASQGVLNDIAGTSGNAVQTTDQYIDKAVNNGSYSAEKIATGDKDELAAVADRVALGGGVNTQAAIDIHAAATLAQTDPMLSSKISKNARQIGALGSGSAAARDGSGNAL